MYIKQLEIDNFKSFANKVAIPLLEGFTTISGPNGSGKSNIIDSVLFALGLSSSRYLRVDSLARFISNHTNRNEAFVKVTLSAGAEESDFTVARRIRKSTQGYMSTYYLNDKTATLSDIHSHLEKYNITPNSYNVIMQQDVTGIVNCTPLERRKIIDEIAGVADFDRRIEKAVEELTTVEQRVEKSTFILNEVDNRLVQLAEEKEVAEKYQKLKFDKTELESQITAVKFFDIKRSLEKAHENILEFNKKKKEEELKSTELEDRLNLLKAEYEKVANEVKEKGEAQQIELKKKAEELKGIIDRKNSAINYAEKQIQDTKKSAENAKNSIETINQNIEKSKLQIELKQEEIKSVNLKIDEKRAELNKILEEQMGLNKTADSYLERRNELRKQHDLVQDKIHDLLNKKLPLEAEFKNLQTELETSERQIEEYELFNKEVVAKKDLLEVKSEELKKEIEDYKIAQQSVLNDLDTNKNEMSDLAYELNILSKKLTTLEVQKDIINSNNFNIAVETVMNANLKGVHAPIAKLATVNKEYSTALEVAIGGRMSHIAVDDEHTASVAIELLKSSNAGRATFVPLNKIAKAPNKLVLPKDKGVVDFAINLIDFDEIYTNVFYYAVGETLVVEDLETAKKLIGRYRVVTLDGEVVEKTGSITGGKLKQNRIKLAQNDDDELERLRDKVTEIEEKLKDLEIKKSNLEAKQRTIRENYDEATTALKGVNIELAGLFKQAENNKVSLEVKYEFVKTAKPKIADLEKQLDKAEEKDVELSQELLEVKSEIEDIEKLINQDDLKRLREQTDDVEAEIKRLESNFININNEISDIDRKIKFDMSVIDTRHSEIDNFEKTVLGLEQDKEVAKVEIDKIKIELEGVENLIEEINETLGELLKKRDDLNAKVLELEKEKHIKASDIERIAEQIESFKARRRELEPELESAKNELEKSGLNVDELKPATISTEEITAKIQRLQKKMDELGDVNMRAINDFERVQSRQAELKSQIETLTSERLQILERMQGYEQLKKETFLKTYNSINVNFKEMFHELSEGEGTLVLSNEEDPLSGGLTIDAQPRDKKVQRLESMSGGEKALTALAFVFAIQRYSPAPFYAFDEVDANLDGINVEKLAHMVQKQSKDTQFIVVSHRKPMIESANRTIGVTQKEKGKTNVTGIKLRD